MLFIEKKIPDNIDVLFIVPPVLRFLNMTNISYPIGLGYLVNALQEHHICAQIYNADYLKPEDATHNGNSGKLKQWWDTIYTRVKHTFGIKSYFVIDVAKRWQHFYREVIDPNHPYWNEVRMVLNTLRPSIVGLSSKVVDIPSTCMVADIAKEVLPDVKVIVGGPSATTCVEYLLHNSHAIDFLVLGEGEQTIVQLVDYLLNTAPSQRNLKEIEGIAFRKTRREIHLTSPRPLLDNLDVLPFVDRTCIFFVDSQNTFRFYVKADDIITSRGCPYPCRFCAVSLTWGVKAPRMRSIDNVIEEIKYLHSTYNQRDFIVWDDLFTINHKRVTEFCQKIREHKLDINWLCLMHLHTISAELLETMKQAGCYEIQVGIESGSDRVLKYIKKGITVEMIREKSHIIRESGLKWRAFFIIGFPTETKSEMEETLQIMAEIAPTFIQLSIFSPYPGTDLHNELKAKNLLGSEFMKSDIWYPYNNYTGTMSNRAFRKFAFRAFKYINQIGSDGIRSGR